MRAAVRTSSAALTGSTSRSRAADLLELMKPRLSALVVLTTAMGYLLAASGPIDGWRLVLTVAGTFLLSAGACALNHVMEIDADARMERTRDRPLPTGRMSRATAAGFSLLLLATGLGILIGGSGALTAWLGVLSALIYVLLYTPLKRVTTLNTVVGALVGALPPMMGWAAATGRLEPGAFLLGGILFVWQIPHFLAIAWMYREDYSRSGFRMLPVADANGDVTARMVVLYSLALIPVSLAAGLIGPVGWLYPLGALALGAGFVYFSVRLQRERSRAAARRVFLASLLYLPVLFLLLAFDPTTGGPGGILP